MYKVFISQVQRNFSAGLIGFKRIFPEVLIKIRENVAYLSDLLLGFCLDEIILLELVLGFKTDTLCVF